MNEKKTFLNFLKGAVDFFGVDKDNDVLFKHDDRIFKLSERG